MQSRFNGTVIKLRTEAQQMLKQTTVGVHNSPVSLEVTRIKP